MSVFKEEMEYKRVIFNVQIDLAERLEQAKKDAKRIGKKLDADTAINKALEKFLKKAEKKILEGMKRKGVSPENDPPKGDAASESVDAPGTPGWDEA